MKSTYLSRFVYLVLSSILVTSIPLHPLNGLGGLTGRDTTRSGLDSHYPIKRNDPDLDGRGVSWDLFERDLGFVNPYDPAERHIGYSDSYNPLERGSSPLESGDIIERGPGSYTPPGPKPRPPTTGRGPGAGGAAIGDAIVNEVEAAKHENEWRSEFVKHLVDETTKQHPGFNVIVCHPDHNKHFEGTEGKDWGHNHDEYPKQATPGTIGFEIYWFKEGTFENKGDGGWINWSYTGNPEKDGPKKLTYS